MSRHSSSVRSYRSGVAIDEPIEPIELPVQTLDQMLRLDGASEVVILSRKENYLGRHAEMLERAKPLLALLDRHAKVVVRMQNQSRRLHVLRVLERRTVPEQFKLLKDVAAEITLVPISSIARAVVADEVRNAAKRHRGSEHISMADDPIGHKSAVASAGHAKPVAIDPRILLQDGFDAAHYVLVNRSAQCD